MKLHKFENREIRSFRMREKILNFKSFFNSKERTACFIMSDSIQPNDRVESREFLSQHGLQLTLISKKVVNLWMQDDLWGPIKELFKGNVIKVDPICKESKKILPFTVEKLQGLISNDLFSVRLFIENQKVYRQDKLKTFLTRSFEGEKFKESIVKEKLAYPLIKGVYIQQFLQLKGNHK